jgi:hypothetical protein
VCLAMLTGCGMYAYTFGTIGTIIQELNKGNEALAEEM